MFDRTAGILRRAWNFKSPRVPSAAELAPLLARIGWDKVAWNGTSIHLTEPGMELDLGGIGKEYAVDRLAALAISHDASALINLGGDVRVVGSRAGAPWRVGIEHPRAKGEVLAGVALNSGSIATSGDYQRYFEVEGRRYHHILSARTGLPTEGFRSVSVVAESCLVAGGAATVAMLLGERKGIKYLAELGLPFLVVHASGTLSSRPAEMFRVGA